MIAFRLDANESVATGHLYRCIAIAKECRKLGEECLFLLAENLFTDIISENGFEYEILNLKRNDWDDGIDKIRNCVLKNRIKCLVVDSYLVTENFFAKLSETVSIFYIDDICKKTYKIAEVLHYSEWEDEHVIENLYEGTETKVIKGMKYMPLRNGFARPREKNTQYDILITTGGTDPYHITQKVLVRIAGENYFEKLKVVAVLGRMNCDRDEIEKLAQSSKNIEVMFNISNMDEVMHASRVAICAGGTSVYELMASGTVFTCFSFSDDQAIFGKKLDKHGNCLYAGDAREGADETAENILLALKKMLERSYNENLTLAEENQKLVDGLGAQRIAKELIALSQN